MDNTLGTTLRNKLNGDYTDLCIEMITKRGVQIDDIAQITYDLQKPYIPSVTIAEAKEAVIAVISKRESQMAILTGLELDRLTEEKLIQGPLYEIIRTDYGLYGIDEIIALSITNIYGSIGLTNFGYLDKEKKGIIKELDEVKTKSNQCNTFLDDLICAIAAGAASRIAHQDGSKDR